jgi:hypothetical protein
MSQVWLKVEEGKKRESFPPRRREKENVKIKRASLPRKGPLLSLLSWSRLH